MPALQDGDTALILSIISAFALVFGVLWLLEKFFPNWNKVNNFMIASATLFAIVVVLIMVAFGIAHYVYAIGLFKAGHIYGCLVNIVLGSVALSVVPATLWPTKRRFS
jgi:hypothetical protein